MSKRKAPDALKGLDRKLYGELSTALYNAAQQIGGTSKQIDARAERINLINSILNAADGGDLAPLHSQRWLSASNRTNQALVRENLIGAHVAGIYIPSNGIRYVALRGGDISKIVPTVKDGALVSFDFIDRLGATQTFTI